MNQPTEKWQLDKRISIADILSVAGSAVMVILAYSTLDKRLAVLESQTVQRTEDIREIKLGVEYIRRTVEELKRHEDRK